MKFKSLLLGMAVVVTAMLPAFADGKVVKNGKTVFDNAKVKQFAGLSSGAEARVWNRSGDGQVIEVISKGGTLRFVTSPKGADTMVIQRLEVEQGSSVKPYDATGKITIGKNSVNFNGDARGLGTFHFWVK